MLDNMNAQQLQALIDLLMQDPDQIEEVLREYAREMLRKRRQRIIRNNQSYEDVLSRMTDKQANNISKFEGNAYKINKVFWHKNEMDGNVAVMLVKDAVYDDVSGKVKRKIIVVYSDGSHDHTFEKSISIRKTL